MDIPIMLFLISTLLGSLVGVVAGKNDYEHKHQLTEDLFVNYDNSILPVKNSSKVLTVTIDLSINQLIELDERNQRMTSSMWMRWYWRDDNLVWNTSEYGYVGQIYLSPDRLWTPDITVYNSIKPEDVGWPQYYYVDILSNGQVTWKFPIFMDTSCKMDMSLFPFDTQRCKIQMGSWAHKGSSVDLKVIDEEGDRSTYVDNGEWNLQEVIGERITTTYPCCPGAVYPDIVYTFVLKRLSLYYVFNLLLPCVLITAMSLLGLVLPVESGEKISLNVTILLTMVVLLLIVADIMPAQSEVIPVIGRYFIACILLMSVSTVASVSVLHFHFRGSRGRPVPVWVRKFVIYKLGKVLIYGKTIQRMEIEPDEEDSREKLTENVTPVNMSMSSEKIAKQAFVHSEEFYKRSLTQEQDIVTTGKQETSKCSQTGSRSASSTCLSCGTRSSARSKTSVNNVKPKPDLFSTPRMTAEHEWMALALVMDRLYFVIFTVATISITIYPFAHMN